MFVPRLLARSVSEALDAFPAVVLIGPRQVGKTTLALAVAAERGGTYLDLELPSDAARLGDPELYLRAHAGRLVVLDEVGRRPDLFPALRGIIDARRRAGERAGMFLLLGSASPELLRQGESLAGRVARRELTPLLAGEVLASGAADLERLWLRGGFPDSLLAPSDRASLDWRREFLRTYLDRDLRDASPGARPETARRLWAMLALRQGEAHNAAALAQGVGVSAQTVARYADLLVGLLLVRRLEPWARNAGKRLVRSPKLYVRDSGALHALLGLGDRDALLGHPSAGHSWEGLVVETLAAAAPEGSALSYYRTAAGAEADLVVEPPGGPPLAFGAKLAEGARPSRGFHEAMRGVGAVRGAVVHAGSARYPVAPGVEAMPLPDAVALLRAAAAAPPDEA